MVTLDSPRALKVTGVQLDFDCAGRRRGARAPDVSGVSERAPQNAASSADRSIPEVPSGDASITLSLLPALPAGAGHLAPATPAMPTGHGGALQHPARISPLPCTSTTPPLLPRTIPKPRQQFP